MRNSTNLDRTVIRGPSAILAIVLASSSASAGTPGCAIAGTALGETKISSTAGGFGGVLDNSDLFGISGTSLGDHDGDGVADLAVGAYADDDGGTDRGAVWILFLNANGTVKAEQKISDTAGGFGGVLDDNDRFGISIANLEDLDGDGVTDLAVGAYLDDDGGTNRGAVWILFLNANGTVKAEQKISDVAGGFNGVLDNDDVFGQSVASLGDLDGDGVAELAVGAFQDDDGGADRGAVWILFLNANGTVKAEQKISDTAGGFNGVLDNTDLFGVSVASLGDLDGDGVADLTVGAHLDDDGGLDRGAVWIFFLNANGTVKAEQKLSDTAGGFSGVLDDNDRFGGSVVSLGDLDGDGVTDLAVGAYFDDDGGTDRGAIWILFLNANGTVKAERKISDTAGGFNGVLDDGDRLCHSVGGSVDLDGDGVADLAVGASADDDGGTDRGAVWIISIGDCQVEPVIGAQPASLILPASGGMAQFQVAATGDVPLMYQWRKDTVPLSNGATVMGADTATLTIAADAGDIGVYDCLVTNISGMETSNTAILAVRDCPGDADGTAAVNFADIIAALANFGAVCP